MTKNDYEEHCLDYCASKKECKNDGSGNKINVPSESCVKECDSSCGNELFGPIWDDIHLKDGVVESRERVSSDLMVKNYTSE